MSIIKTTRAAKPSDNNTPVYMDKSTSQLYIVAQISRGITPADRVVTLWDCSECEPEEFSSATPLTERGFCPVNSGEITLAIAERALGHVGEQISDLEDRLQVLKSVESACRKIIKSSDEED